MTKVFIDGKEGTTGLKIYERFAGRKDIEVLAIPEEKRKDAAVRKQFIESSDITFLCLPDVAAKEAVSLCENPLVKIIDASTAHRTNPEWAYGLPELSDEHRKKIEKSKRVAVPGCHASGASALIYPLIAGGIAANDYPFVMHSITGYSGGGKSMIAEYESESRAKQYDSPRQYGLSLSHKHIPEIMSVSGLKTKPILNPIVADFYSGMCVTVPVFADRLNKELSLKDIREYYCDYYKGQKLITVCMPNEEKTFLAANEFSGTSGMQIYIGGNDGQFLLTARFDNLGKGASGAAVQCMNIMLNLDETTSLI